MELTTWNRHIVGQDILIFVEGIWLGQKKFKEIVEEVLKEDHRIWDKEKTEFNIPLLFNLIDKMDETIIGLLFDREETKNKFFWK